MKTVFTNREIAHVWASRKQEHGRANNIFFDGNTIYSYGRHFPMARFETGRPGVVLYNASRYSTTTAKHKGIVRRALHGLDLHVHAIPATLWNQPKDALAWLVEERNDAYLSAARARTNAQWKLSNAEGLAHAATRYAIDYGLAIPDPIDDATISAMRERAARLAREKSAADKRRREEQARRNAEARDKWLAGENVHFYQDTPTLLRAKPDGTIETSRGATVPQADSRALWDAVVAVRASGHALIPAHDRPITVGHFTLIGISANGDARIGCHHLTYDIMLAMATQLGWL